MKKTNGTGNHGDEDGQAPENAGNIARFPTPAERAEIERLKAAMEDARRAAPHKSEPVLNMPPVVKALSGILCLIHIGLYFAPKEIQEQAIGTLSFIPARYSGVQPFQWVALLGPFTHVLLHGGWLHLGINVGTLMAFGSGIEKTVGGKKLLLLFVATSLLGALMHYIIVPTDGTPLIGASGGISGLFGAVLVMAQDQGRMAQQGWRGLMPFILMWVGISLFFGLYGMPGESSAIAWTVHIGGFIAGLLLYRPIAKLKI